MRQGGRYVRDPKTGKTERVEWTKTTAEVEAEAAAKSAAKKAKAGAKAPAADDPGGTGS